MYSNTMTRASEPVSTAGTSRRPSDRWFYVGVTSSVILLNLMSFGPSIIHPSARTVPLPLTSIDLAHVLVSVAWLLVFLAQVTLVAAGRTAVHRRMGIAGVLLSAAFIVVTWFMLVEGARRGFDLGGDLVPRGTTVDPGTFLAPAEALVPFGVFVAAAVWCRRRPAVHKRLMMLAMWTTTGAPVAHLMGHFPAFRVLAFLIGLRAAGRAFHPRSTFAGSHPPRIFVGGRCVLRLGQSILHPHRAYAGLARLCGLDCSWPLDGASRLSSAAGWPATQTCFPAVRHVRDASQPLLKPRAGVTDILQARRRPGRSAAAAETQRDRSALETTQQESLTMTRMTHTSVSRRQLLTGALATGTSLGLFGASTIHAQAKDSPFVLVHGAWHGGWCWRRVGDRSDCQGALCRGTDTLGRR